VNGVDDTGVHIYIGGLWVLCLWLEEKWRERKQQGGRYTCVGYIVMEEALFTSGNVKWYNFLASPIAISIKTVKDKVGIPRHCCKKIRCL
jgi:hypothetical protein